MAWEPPEVSGKGWTPPEVEQSSYWDDIKHMGKSAAGIGAAAADLIQGVPKMIGGMGIAGIDTALGERADIARTAAQEAMEETYPSIGGKLGLDQTMGYKGVMYPFEKIAEGIDWIGNKVSDDPHKQGLAKQALDIGSFVAPGIGLKAGKGAYKALKDTSTPYRGEGREPTMGEIRAMEGAREHDLIAPEVEVMATREPWMPPEVADLNDGPMPGSKGEMGYTRQEPKGHVKSPEDIVAEAIAAREAKANAEFGQQGDLFTSDNMYGTKDSQFITGPDGHPFDPVKTAELGDQVARSGESGDLLAGHEPYQGPVAGRPTESPKVPYTKLKTENLTIEKQSAAGPVRGKSQKVVTDDLRLPKIEENPHALAPEPREPGLTFEPSPLEGKPLEDAILSHLRNERERTIHPFGRKQGGVIDKDLLTLGTAKVFENLGRDAKKLLEKFKGTFHEYQIRNMIHGAEDPRSKTTVVLMSPDDFHLLARARGHSSPDRIEKLAAIDDQRKDFLGEEKRESIRKGLKTQEGLEDIPFLWTTRDGNVLQVMGHNGRHRMDVFSEQGMDLIPVRLMDNSIEWGRSANIPKKIRGEDGVELPTPQSLFFPRGEAAPMPGFVPKNQRGSVDPQVFIEGIKKGSKSVDDFTKKLVDELGEHMRPIAAALYHKGDQQQAPETPTPKDVPSVVDQNRKALISDTREVGDVIQAYKGKKFEDIGKNWTNFLPGSNVADLAKKVPVIKWIVDRSLMHDRQARVSKENAKYGAEFAAKRGLLTSKWNRRLKSDDGAITLFERMNIRDAEQALQVWRDQFDGKKDITQDALDQTELNATQKRAIIAASGQLKKFLDQYNRLAEEHGYTKISPRQGYFPHIWEGDYRVKVKNSLGETVQIWGAKTANEANTIAKDLGAKFADYHVEVGEAKSRYDLNDTKAFREAMGILDSTDPLKESLQSAYHDILRHRGFQKQTLFRTGKPGYLGSAEGKAGVRDSIRALELYLDRGYNFLSNQKKRSDLANMMSGLKEELSGAENAKGYMGAFVDHSSGALESGLKAIDSIVEMAGSATGVGKSGGKNLLSGVNGLASAYWLSTPRFVITQLVQPLYALPKALQLKGAGLTTKSVGTAFVKAYYEAMFNPSKETIAGMNWAKEQGFIDSKILDLMGAKFDSKAKTLGTLFQTYSKFGLGKIEQEAVRTPTFIFYDMLLRDTIKNNEARWEAAGMLTDKYMVDYTPTDSPLLYGHMGVLGDAARPLKQFQHAYAGQLMEYLKAAKDDKHYAPVAAFIGTQFTMSGLKGLMFAAEASALVLLINNLFGTQIPTVDEWLASSGLSDTMVFGGVSQLTGMDMSGSLGAPQIQQTASLPGVEFGTDMALKVGSLALEYMKGTETEADKMLAAKAVTPNALQGVVEEAFTKPGEGTPNPNNRMIPNLGPRNDADKAARMWGGRSVGEARQMMSLRSLDVSDAQRKKIKDKSVNVIVDRIAEGKEPPAELVQKWVKLGGNPKELDEAILGQLKARAMTKAQRYLGSMKGLSSAQKAERLQKFGIQLEKTSNRDAIVNTLKGMQ